MRTITGDPLPRLDDYFKQLDLRSQIILCQIPLLASIALVVVAMALFSPATLTNPLFQFSQVPHLIIIIVCVAVPWERLPSWTSLAVPLLDMFAIGLTRQSEIQTLSTVGILLIYPIVWLSASRLRAGLIASVAGAIMCSVLPSLIFHGGQGLASMVRPFLLTFVLGALSVVANSVSTGLRRQYGLLKQKNEELLIAVETLETSEQLVRNVVDTVSAGVLVVDKRGKQILANGAQLAFMSATDTTDRSPESLMPLYTADRITPIPEHEHPIRRAVNGETFVEELVWIVRDENIKVLSVSARSISDESGNHKASVLAFSDVTALSAALSAKDDFVGNISHELRTPLTSLLGYLELIADDPSDLSAEVASYLQTIQRNAYRLDSLVRDLISVAANDFDTCPNVVDVSDLITRCLTDYQRVASVKAIQLVCETEGPLLAYVDSSQIGRVIENLLSNAVKYSPHGGTVTVSARKLHDGDVQLRVRDAGRGMSATEQRQAFDAFSRGTATRREAIPGAGLGLPMSKTLVERNGGTIAIASAAGMGTTVTVALPRPPLKAL